MCRYIKHNIPKCFKENSFQLCPVELEEIGLWESHNSEFESWLSFLITVLPLQNCILLSEPGISHLQKENMSNSCLSIFVRIQGEFVSSHIWRIGNSNEMLVALSPLLRVPLMSAPGLWQCWWKKTRLNGGEAWKREKRMKRSLQVSYLWVLTLERSYCQNSCCSWRVN